MALNNASAFWNFDSSLTDSSGNGNTLSAVGSPDYTTGKLGNALRSPTTNDYASKSGLVISSGSFSMGGFFFLTSAGLISANVMSQYSTADSRVQALQTVSAGATGTVTFQVDDSGSGPGGDLAGIPAWFHFVGTYNSLTNACILYLNGSAVATATITALFSPADQFTAVAPGGSNRRAELCFFYPFVLTPAEVTTLYNGGAGYNPYEGPYYVAMAQTHCAGAVGSQVHNAGAVGGQHHVAGAVAGMIGGQP